MAAARARGKKQKKSTMDEGPTIPTKPPGDDGISFRAIVLLLHDLLYQMNDLRERKKGKESETFQALRPSIDAIIKVGDGCQKGMTIPYP